MNVQGSYGAGAGSSPFAACRSAFASANLPVDGWRRPVLPPAPASFSAADASEEKDFPAGDDESDFGAFVEKNQTAIIGTFIGLAVLAMVAFR